MKKFLIAAILLLSACCMISCGGGSGSSSSPGTDTGVPSSIHLMPSRIVVQTNSAVTFNAKVIDGNGSALRNVPVRFTKISAIGELYNERNVRLTNPVVKTNNYGIATVRLKSFSEGFATVQAEVNKGLNVVRDTRTVFFAVNTNLEPFMYLDVDCDNDGIFSEPGVDFTLFNPTNNQALVRATVFNKFGQRASGSYVIFGSDSSEVSFPTGDAALTNSNGEAFVLIQVDPIAIRNFTTVLNIVAYADNGAANMVSLNLKPVTVSRISVTANPSVVAPDGTSSILATVFLNSGTQAPDGSTVSFVASCGTVTPFAQTSGSIATASFTAPSIPPSSGRCEVTASMGGVTSSPPATIYITTDLSVQPGEQTVNGGTGGNAIYTIFGGVAPYTVTSSKPGIAFNGSAGNGMWTVANSGETFTVTVAPGTPEDDAVLTVRDSLGETVEAKLIIGAGSALSIQPGEQTVAAGNTATFSIFGGAPPYNVFSADASLQPDPATVTASGGQFVVNVPASTAPTSVVYTVQDSAGATATARLIITSEGPEALTIVPGSVTAIGATGGTFTFTITGGTPAYVITSTDPAKVYNTTAGNGIWTVGASGGTFTATVPAGAEDATVTLNVFDIVGETTSATLTITGGGTPTVPALTLNPASISVTGVIGTGDNVTFTIGGGTAPYSVYSTNTAVVPSPSVSGSQFTIDPQVVVATTAVTLTVVDSVGETKTAAVTVTPASSSMGLNPSTIAVTAGTSNIAFNIIGGVAPYTVYSDNTGVATIVGGAGGPYTTSGTSFGINAIAAGTAKISVVDSDGQTVTANVTVTVPPLAALNVSPSGITLTGFGNPDGNNADNVTFLITGGTSPYAMFSSNDALIASQGALAGSTFTIDPDAVSVSTPVTLTVVDSVGATKTVTVTITPPATSMVINPSTISVNINETVPLYILGGLSPYTIYTSDAYCAPVPASPFAGTFFNVVVPNDGACSGRSPVITLEDSLGKTTTATVTIN